MMSYDNTYDRAVITVICKCNRTQYAVQDLDHAYRFLVLCPECGDFPMEIKCKPNMRRRLVKDNYE